MNKLKTAAKVTAVIIGVLAMLYAVLITIVANFNIGNLIVFGVGFVIAVWCFVPRNSLFLILKALAAFGLAVLFGMIGFIYFAADANKADYTEDAVIVLGCSVIGDRISLPLKYRLDAAIDYYSYNKAALIVVSGGQGPQENLPEGAAMANYLIENGIPRDNVLIEDKATSTNENYRFSKVILDKRLGTDYRCVYVTNRFHSYRAGRLAEINGLNAVSYSATINPMAAPSSYAREVLAVFQLWLFNR